MCAYYIGRLGWGWQHHGGRIWGRFCGTFSLGRLVFWREPAVRTLGTYTEKVRFTKTNQYGCGPDKEDDVYTVDEFKACVASSAFVDSDGFGHPVKDSLSDPSIDIRPSRLKYIPKDATHIVWYNK